MRIAIMAHLLMDDFEEYFKRRHQKLYPGQTRDIRHSTYSKEELIAVLNSEDFFLNAPVTIDPFAAIKGMLDLGHEVLICMTQIPPLDNPTGFLQQAQWLQKNLMRFLGDSLGFVFYRDHVILTKNRTIISCDILISDDWEEGRGRTNQSWRLVVYSTRYNKGSITWNNWREVFEN